MTMWKAEPGSHVRAMRECRRQLSRDPLNPQALLRAGALFFHLGDPDSGIPLWTRAIHLMLAGGQRARCTPIMRQLLTIAPADPRVQACQEKMRESVMQFRDTELTEMNPENVVELGPPPLPSRQDEVTRRCSIADLRHLSDEET